MAQCVCVCVCFSQYFPLIFYSCWPVQFLFPLAFVTPIFYLSFSKKNTHYNENHPLVNSRRISHSLLPPPAFRVTLQNIRDNYYRKLLYYWQSLSHPFNNTSTCAESSCAWHVFDTYACTSIYPSIHYVYTDIHYVEPHT